MIRKILGILVALGLILMIGCSKSSNSSQTSQLDQNLENISKTAYATIDLIASTIDGNEMITSGENFNLGGADVPIPPNEMKEVFQKLEFGRELEKKHIFELQGFQKVDSLIFYQEFGDSSGNSGYIKILYDSDTDLLKLFYVVLSTPSSSIIARDSILFEIKANYTIYDNSDDLMKGLHEVTEFRDVVIVQQKTVDVVVNQYNANNEPIDISYHEVDDYSELSFLLKRTANGSIVVQTPDTTLSLGERYDFRNGEYVEKTVSFSTNGTGSYTETRSNGLSAEGTIDILEDDGHGELHYTLTFPEGSSIKSISRDAIVDLDQNTGEVTETFKHLYVFADNSVDSAVVTIHSLDYFNSGTVTFSNSKGESGELAFGNTDEYTYLNGWVIDAEQHYILLDIKEYADRTQDIHITVYESQSAYNSGADPIYEIHLIVTPDGSGEGEMTTPDGSYQVKLKGDGTMDLTKDGVTYTVNVWE